MINFAQQVWYRYWEQFPHADSVTLTVPSVSDPHKFQCWSGSSIFPQCGSGSCSRIQLQCFLQLWLEKNFVLNFFEKFFLFLRFFHLLLVSNMILVQVKRSQWFGTGILVLLSTFKFEPAKNEKFRLILLSWIRIRIRILNADPDPDPAYQNRCGSVRIRIRNTASTYLKKVNRGTWCFEDQNALLCTGGTRSRHWSIETVLLLNGLLNCLPNNREAQLW